MKHYVKNKIWLFLVGVALVVILKTDFSAQLGRIYRVLLPVIIGFVFAWFLIPLKLRAEFFLNKRFKNNSKNSNRLIAVFGTYIAFLGAVAFFIICLIPVLGEGITSAVEQLSVYKGFFEKYVQGNLLEKLLSKINLQMYINGARSTLAIIFDSTMAFVVLVYILLEHRTLKKQVMDFTSRLITTERAERLLFYLSRTNYIFTRYFYGKLISSLILGVIVTAGFFITGISHPLFFGMVVGLFNMLPIFCALVSSVPVALLTFTEYGLYRALTAVAVILLGQQVENGIITPKIVGDRVGLSGFWIIVTTITGGGLFGFWGLLICVPVAATIKDVYGIIGNSE